MTFAKWAMLAYALAMIGMGLHGYFGSGSLMSLAGGGGIGVIVLVGLWFAIKRPNPRVGYIVSLIVALLATGRFLPTYLKPDGKVYPHLVIVLLSGLLVVCLLGAHFVTMAAKKKGA